MRRLLTTLVLVATCGLLVLAMAQSVIGASASHGRAHIAATRSWPVSMSPGPGELALAQITFPVSDHEQITRASLQVAVSGPFGDDYLASATPLLAPRGAPRVLVALVNRASPLLDPVTVQLRVTALASLGAPMLRRASGAFARPAAGALPAVCDLPLHGHALSGAELGALGSRGAALTGFDAADAVAQAYDVRCGLPYASSFKLAVEHTAPVAPVGRVPGEGCRPAPGYACPGVASEVPRVGRLDDERRAAAGSH
jgi:hypothetical protein